MSRQELTRELAIQDKFISLLVKKLSDQNELLKDNGISDRSFNALHDNIFEMAKKDLSESELKAITESPPEAAAFLKKVVEQTKPTQYSEWEELKETTKASKGIGDSQFLALTIAFNTMIALQLAYVEHEIITKQLTALGESEGHGEEGETKEQAHAHYNDAYKNARTAVESANEAAKAANKVYNLTEISRQNVLSALEDANDPVLDGEPSNPRSILKATAKALLQALIAASATREAYEAIKANSGITSEQVVQASKNMVSKMEIDDKPANVKRKIPELEGAGNLGKQISDNIGAVAAHADFQVSMAETKEKAIKEAAQEKGFYIAPDIELDRFTALSVLPKETQEEEEIAEIEAVNMSATMASVFVANAHKIQEVFDDNSGNASIADTNLLARKAKQVHELFKKIKLPTVSSSDLIEQKEEKEEKEGMSKELKNELFRNYFDIKRAAIESKALSEKSPESKTLRAANAGCQKLFKNAQEEFEKLMQPRASHATETKRKKTLPK